MAALRYIEKVVTLELDREACLGCRVCVSVCPHSVFEIAEDKRARIRDLGACMECGACKTNCAWNAISLEPGVGCADAIIHSWIYGGEPTCGCGEGESAGSSCCGGEDTAPAGSSCCGDEDTAPAGSSCCGGDEGAPASSCCSDSGKKSGCC